MERARAPRLRSMREFAEQEIVLPSGPDEGLRFNCRRQPYTALLFDAIDSDLWNRFVILGPSQSGKSLCGFQIPSAYHLFEVQETIIQALPSMETAKDKWREDLRPVIECTRYKEYLPEAGPGSRGGKVEAIKFRNGVTLKYMSGGGGDKRRSSFTARVVVITETDALDESGGSSREADKITQIENRTAAFGNDKRVYLECTVSIERGRTWREYKESTESRIVIRCPKCRHYVSPERAHLRGWQEAETELQARRQAHFVCPQCSGPWTNRQRVTANRDCKLLHRGQTIDKAGRISGDPPETPTLGFRWSAVHNLFWTAGDIGAREWRARRDPDEENAEKELCQFVWAIPYIPPELDLTPLVVEELQRRTHGAPRGLVPPEIDCLTAFADLGKFLLHWMVTAWTYQGRGYVVDYGRFEIPTDDFGVERATAIALNEYRDRMLVGFARAGDEAMVPQFAWIDSGWADSRDVVYQFCRAMTGDRFLPAIGRGETQRRMRRYISPSKRTRTVIHIGEEYHVSTLPAQRLFLVEVNSDHWKSWIQERLACPADSATALTFFAATPNEHMRLARHITAERQFEEYPPGKPLIVRWEQLRRANHWFDCLYNCAAEAHHAGVRLVQPIVPQAAGQTVAKARRRGDDDRPFLISER